MHRVSTVSTGVRQDQNWALVSRLRLQRTACCAQLRLRSIKELLHKNPTALCSAPALRGIQVLKMRTSLMAKWAGEFPGVGKVEAWRLFVFPQLLMLG